ncbi:MAG: RNase P subunit p30 family protein [Candidatus Bathyarchaeia archaeon]
MRRFADLHLINPGQGLSRMAERAALLGYDLIGLTLKGRPEDPGSLKREFLERGVDVALRIDLSPRSRQELLSLLGRYRPIFEVVSVNCANKAICDAASRDGRVDLIFFGEGPIGPRVRLPKEASSALEVNIRDLIAADGARDIGRALRKVRRDLEVAFENGMEVVASSGAEDPDMMRGPREIASLLKFLGMGSEEALASVSETPISLVRSNRMKLRGEVVCDGVRVRGGSGGDG